MLVAGLAAVALLVQGGDRPNGNPVKPLFRATAFRAAEAPAIDGLDGDGVWRTATNRAGLRISFNRASVQSSSAAGRVPCSRTISWNNSEIGRSGRPRRAAISREAIACATPNGTS